MNSNISNLQLSICNFLILRVISKLSVSRASCGHQSYKTAFYKLGAVSVCLPPLWLVLCEILGLLMPSALVIAPDDPVDEAADEEQEAAEECAQHQKGSSLFLVD